MIKVQILTKCKHCDGEAYLPVGEIRELHRRDLYALRALPAVPGQRQTDPVDQPEGVRRPARARRILRAGLPGTRQPQTRQPVRG